MLSIGGSFDQDIIKRSTRSRHGDIVLFVDRTEVVGLVEDGSAVALGKPVVVPIGPTEDGHTRHHLERQRVLIEDVDCRPCRLRVCPIDHRCMTRISPERLVAAANELMAAAEFDSGGNL